jgi:heme A synthase
MAGHLNQTQGSGSAAGYRRGPHRWAIVLAWTTFPLISIGGLVTTYAAGMAVPDWPGTFGYNLFLYPWQTWLFGPWDLFIEHGHRLLGALVGLLTIGFVVAVYRQDDRPWVRWLAVGALVAVIAQGSLGGARVLLDERQLAMLHGCAGPAFFALCIVLCAVTSRWWQEAAVHRLDRASRFHAWIVSIAVLAYVQLVIGALMRHVSESASPLYFEVTVWAHVIGAGILTVAAGVIVWQLVRKTARKTGLAPDHGCPVPVPFSEADPKTGLAPDHGRPVPVPFSEAPDHGCPVPVPFSEADPKTGLAPDHGRPVPVPFSEAPDHGCPVPVPFSEADPKTGLAPDHGRPVPVPFSEAPVPVPFSAAAFRWPASTLALLIFVQLALGCATWVVKYHWPTFVVRTSITTVYTLIEAKGLLQSLVVTSHAANGTLILGVSVLLAARAMRLVQRGSVE